MTTPDTKSLYDRLGRVEGITRIVHDVMQGHLANPLIATRFRASQNLDQVELRVVEFFCAGAGGPEQYTGRELLATHRGMNVSEQEFIAAVDDIVRALEKNEVDAATRGEVVGILFSLKDQVLRV